MVEFIETTTFSVAVISTSSMSATLITFGTAPTISEVFQRPCSRVILLYDGKIEGDGSAEQILGDKKLLETHRMELPFRFHQAAL